MGDNGTVLAPPEALRPLRKDAERNRIRILEAARELFAERGLGVTLNDVAHHAGVGVGTVYRRFPDKAELIDALFEQRIEEIIGLMQDALLDPDAWHGLRTFLERSTELQAADRGLKDLLTTEAGSMERISEVRARLTPMSEQLLARAKAAGQLREDIHTNDLPLVQVMTSIVIDAASDVAPDLYKRSLGILLRGMAARPDDEPPLGAQPLDGAGVDTVLTCFKSPRR